MFPLILSLVVIGIAAFWFFSCTDSSPVCQINQSFSIGAGIMGLICLALAVFCIVEDRRGNGRYRKPYHSHRPYDPHRDDLYCGRCGSPLPHTRQTRDED